LLDVADLCWQADEREFQYVGTDLLRARATTLRVADLDRLYTFIVHKSWWDTIDALAAHPAGTLVKRYPELGAVMDVWIDDDNIWVARVAILHQLRYKDAVNEARLFSSVEKRAADTEFFIRKALGWALRDYARVAPDAVRDFVNSHQDALSGLTKREALKHL
jgi:3-methyladenine DNA glycosylase AlkD